MTLGEGLVAFILADGTINATISTVYPAATVPQEPPTYFASYRFLPGGSIGDSLQGAGDFQRVRIEVTFWGDLNAVTERLAVRLGMIAKSLNGTMVGGGPLVSVYRIIGPRSVENTVTRLFGCQIDLMSNVDLSTTS